MYGVDGVDLAQQMQEKPTQMVFVLKKYNYTSFLFFFFFFFFGGGRAVGLLDYISSSRLMESVTTLYQS